MRLRSPVTATAVNELNRHLMLFYTIRRIASDVASDVNGLTIEKGNRIIGDLTNKACLFFVAE